MKSIATGNSPQATPALHGFEAASTWVQRWSHLVRPGGVVLDVACGYGRHARWFHALNHPLALVDWSQSALDFIADSLPADAFEARVCDIENGPWPFAGRQFDAVVVTNYLWRPLLPTLLASLAPGGVLIYETFAIGNETVGKPSRPEFLLRPGELLGVCRGLRVVAFEDGFTGNDDALDSLDSPDQHHANPAARPRFIQRLAAVREAPTAGPSLRYGL